MSLYLDSPLVPFARMDYMYANGLQVWVPQQVQASTWTKPSVVAHRVKFAADVKPVDGWPAYNIDHAAPLLTDPSTLEGGNFFGGVFGIWLGEDSDAHGSPLCRPVRIHELLRMIGVADETLSNFPTHLAVKRLQIAPGVRGLATVLAALKTAEAKVAVEIDCSDQFVHDTNLHSFMLYVAPHEPIPDPAPVPANEFVLEQALTLPLPTNTA
jgi:hypothetical protein